MNDPASAVKDRTFPGNPEPPAESDFKPASSETSAKTPAGNSAPPASLQAPQEAEPDGPKAFYHVVSGENGALDVYESTAEDPMKKLWPVKLPYDDAKKVLDASARYNSTTQSWEAPKEVVDALGQGRLAPVDWIKANYGAGEEQVVSGLIGAKFLYGQMAPEEAIAKSDPGLLKAQLGEVPEAAWSHGFGAMIADAIRHPISNAEGAARFTAGQVAQTAPFVGSVLGSGLKSAAATGVVVTAGLAGTALAVGSEGLTVPAFVAAATPAVVKAMKMMGEVGIAKRTAEIMGGNMALDLLRKGVPPNIARGVAIPAGVIQGALGVMQFNFLTAPLKRVAIEKVLTSEPVQMTLKTLAASYAKGVAGGTAVMATQTVVDDLSKNMALAAAGMSDQELSLPDIGKNLLDSAVKGFVVSAVAQVPGTVIEGMAGAKPAGPEGARSAELGTPEGAPSPEGEGTPLKTSPTGKEISGPLPESVASEPKFVKAAKEAAPHLEGVDPTDRPAVQKVLDKTLAEHEDLRGEMRAKMDESLSREVPTEDLTALAEKGRAQIEKLAALGKFVNTVDELAKAADEKPGEFFKPARFNIRMGADDATTAEEIRSQFSGVKNEQIVRGNQLAAEIKRMVPDPKEREGMFWYKAADGDREVLGDALKDPELSAYHAQIQAALDLSPKALDALQKVGRYYEEAGAVAQKTGTIKSVLENYQNRIYKPEKAGDFVKNETKSGIKQTTRHSMSRVYNTEFDAARAGKVFATTDVADALSIHNEEMARVNTSRKMADAMAKAGLGAWKREVPEGWAPVGSLQKVVPIKDINGNAVVGEDGNQLTSRSLFVAPEGIAKGLEAIADPNFVKKIDALRNIQRYQGLVKTLDLSFSLFHHITMLAQTIYQRDFSTLMKLKNIDEFLNHSDAQEIELDFVRNEGMTAMVDANQDILRNLTENNDDIFSKIVNAPGVKSILRQVDKNANFLFGKMQRLMKILSYGTRVANWLADHPDATNEEVTAAKRGYARHVNAAFGGLNWEAMGMTKSNLSLLRLGLLAPDWTISNIQLLKQAIGEGGTAGNASRAHILTALTVGMAGTEMLNIVLTGHSTSENPPGHKLEVEIAPDVYVSLLRGGIGDISKFASMLAESGLGGVSRFAQGKLSPLARTGAGLATNTQYTGQPIVPRNSGPVAGTYDVLKYLLSSAAPVPLGLSNLLLYAGKEEDPNAVGAAAIATGAGRYSTPRKGE